MGFFFFLISKNVRVPSFKAKQWVRQRTINAFCDFLGRGMEHWPAQAKARCVERGDALKTAGDAASLSEHVMNGSERSWTQHKPHGHYPLTESPDPQRPSNSSSPGIPKPRDYQEHLPLYKERLPGAPLEAAALASAGPEVPAGGPRASSISFDLPCYLPYRSVNGMCGRFYDAFSHKRFMTPKKLKKCLHSITPQW